MKRIAFLLCTWACLTALGGNAAQARALTMAVTSEPTSMDPLFSRTANNIQSAENIFERLVSQDGNLQIHPGLAVSWRALDPMTWEFALRPGVRFQDGSPFTSADVAFSLQRARNVPNSPAPFSGAVANITRIETPTPLTVRIHTITPSPALVEQVGMVYIVSQRAATGHSSSDYGLPAVAIGTGPYRLKRWIPGDRVELIRNDFYWGARPQFDTCTIRYVSNDASRLSLLLSGAVDLIDNVPPITLDRLRRAPGVTLVSSASARLIYLALDSSRETSPFVTDAHGGPIASNPLRDRRVRLAISMMIDRAAITQHLLPGAGMPAGQIVPEGIGGYDPRLQPQRYDPAGARKLLAQAGYPGGFGLTLHSSNDRFAGDSDLGQALGSMLARGGITIRNVVTQPYNVYAGAAAKRSYSAFVFSFGNSTSDSANGLTNVIASYDRDLGTGAFNRTRYSNPVVDRLLAQAAQSFDAQQRDRLLREAAYAGFQDVAIVPLYFPINYWATRNGVEFRPNKMERTSLLFTELQRP
ncbi:MULTISPECIES: ABC transporter substrate-binding protein [Ralstonia]|uniref:ABC transporter substrate-binding protein n=1 Tax=Ralstonia TaxID=48736 RepID=UPI000DD4EBFB|nr:MULTISPECIES: ABC transporter substrate-binding protein [unclassified Ralstonia]